jgi:hypothetical protein
MPLYAPTSKNVASFIFINFPFLSVKSQIWSINGESKWKAIFVYIPDPLILRCQAKIISSTIIEDATDLISFFELV